MALIYQLLDKKLALISAPAGYGKTSVLIDFAHQSDIPVCWLSLDALDTDTQRFVSYFTAALAQQFPKFGKQTRTLLAEITSFEPKQLERLVVTLVNELYEQSREHFVLILDDYHLVNHVEEIQHFINRFIQLVDENCHLIISSRSLIPLPDLALMVARQQVDGLSNFELAFRATEIKSLFEKNYHTRLSDQEAREMEEVSEGWITGLQLSGMLTKEDGELPRITRASGIGLFEYFGHQIFDQQPKDLQDFLLYSSLLEEFDAELCETVLARFVPEHQAWSGLINTLLQKNLFALPVGADRKWIRYHHLFRDFLQTTLYGEQPELAEAILYRLAEVHVEKGDWEKAWHSYLQLEDFPALSQLTEKAGTHLLQKGRLLTLKNWLNQIPETLRQSPELLSLQGTVLYVMGSVEQGLALLNEAEKAFRAIKNGQGLARTLVRRTTAHQYAGNYTASLADAEEALMLTDVNEALADIRLDALRSKGLSLFYLGQGQQAVEWLEKALEGYTRLNKTESILVALMELGMVHHSVGHLKNAQTHYEKAFDIGQTDKNYTWMAELLNNIGVLYHLQAKYIKSAESFEKGLEYARKSGYIRKEALLLASLGDLYVDIGETEAAKKCYAQAAGLIKSTNDFFLNHYLILAQAKVARLQEKYAQARHLLAQVQKQIHSNSPAYEQGLLHLEIGRLDMVEGNIPQALRNLKAAKQCFGQGGRYLEHSWSQLWFSCAAYQLGEIDITRTELKSMLKSSSREQVIHTLAPQILQIQARMKEIQDDPLIGKTFHTFIGKVKQNNAKISDVRKRIRYVVSVVPISKPRITILALGRAQVKINGKVIPLSTWKTQSVRELFFYFLNTPQAVSKEQIGLVFWPEIAPAKLKMRFKNNLYRLRRAIGSETITFDNDLYAFNRQLDYDYDVDIFDNHIQYAETASNEQERITHYQAAVDLVRGPYLSDFHTIWVWPERERLNQAYISALLNLAELYFNTNSLEKAKCICLRALKYDSCLENIHRLLMNIFSLLGDRAAIVRQYQLCRETLKEELGIEPSEETETLYLKLAQ
ncbi:MAG: tetratricopeptide repeat protein [Anaerolineales bacterium]|nr:tetratricopeptide repeat protein [Anaerolineales bacterium]